MAPPPPLSLRHTLYLLQILAGECTSVKSPFSNDPPLSQAATVADLDPTHLRVPKTGRPLAPPNPPILWRQCGITLLLPKGRSRLWLLPTSVVL